MHVGRLRARQGPASSSPNMSRPTRRPARASRCCSPPAASSASTMSARRRGAPPTPLWHEEDRLEIHPHDAEQRGISDGDWVKLASRVGETALRALDHRPRRAGRRLHDLPPSRHPGERRHHRVLRLGDQLPGIQGDRGAGHRRPTARPTGRRLWRSLPPQPPHRRRRAGRIGDGGAVEARPPRRLAAAAA